MKTKSFLMAFAAIAAVSMSSCSQEEELVSPDNQLRDNAVVFGTYIGASRGSVIDTDALKAEGAKGFGVMAYYTGQDNFGTTSVPNFMYNQQVTYSEGVWKYTPLKYWPNNSGDKISFFAYAPYTSTFGREGITKLSSNEAKGDPTLEFVVAENVSDQIDLLYAGAAGKVENSLLNLTKPATGENVTLNFKHALSRVSFSRQLMVDNDKKLDANTTITINSVTFSAVGFGTKGTLNLNTGAWDVTESKEKAYELSTAKNNIQNNVIAGGNNSTNIETLTAANGNIMFIPVDMTTVADAQGKIIVNYTVTTTDDNLVGGESAITNNIEVEVPAITFEAGKAYNFVLKIGLTSVKLDAQVANWADGTITNWDSIVF